MQRLLFHNPDRHILQTSDLCLKSLTHVDEVASWKYNRHCHSDIAELMFLEEGTSEYSLGPDVYTLQAGDVIFVNAGVVHAEKPLGSEPFSLWTLSFSGVSLFGLEPNQLIPSSIYPVIAVGQVQGFLSQRFSDLYGELISPQLYTDERCKFIVGDILLQLSRILHTTSYNRDLRDPDSISDRAMQYINEHYTDPITLNELAELFYCSPYHLNHEMKRKLGISPINYLISRRLGEAQRLLLSTNMKIVKIADRVGYENTQYFTNLFKKYVGCSPRDFRRTFVSEYKDGTFDAKTPKGTQGDG
ncbi:AraC family transcriptional regulator [uncultured Oscillibacter sp.]|uniref:AraC family transcriptional regulator n=1 Tax=uncultured Oscillibacter sp. TaxID=876091 RepID=UPI0027297BD0|nr:AraC family transcriptional regulator [uncultured Oscillibacter sp.]